MKKRNKIFGIQSLIRLVVVVLLFSAGPHPPPTPSPVVERRRIRESSPFWRALSTRVGRTRKKKKKNKKTPFNCLRFHKQFWTKSISIREVYIIIIIRRKRHDEKRKKKKNIGAMLYARACVLINIRRFTETFPKSNKTFALGVYRCFFLYVCMYIYIHTPKYTLFSYSC